MNTPVPRLDRVATARKKTLCTVFSMAATIGGVGFGMLALVDHSVLFSLATAGSLLGLIYSNMKHTEYENQLNGVSPP